MIAQNVNPARPDTPRNFAASYRGFLRIEEAGTYKFFLGAEHAAFLFIDGERVWEQKGAQHFAVTIPANAWAEVELTAGVHPSDERRQRCLEFAESANVCRDADG